MANNDCDLIQTAMFNDTCHTYLIESLKFKIKTAFKRVIKKNFINKYINNNSLTIRYIMCDYNHYIIDIDKEIKKNIIKSGNSIFLFYFLGLNNSNFNRDNHDVNYNCTLYTDWNDWCIRNNINPDKELIDVASIPNDYDNIDDNKYKCDIRYLEALYINNLTDTAKFGANLNTTSIHHLLSIFTYLIRDKDRDIRYYDWRFKIIFDDKKNKDKNKDDKKEG